MGAAEVFEIVATKEDGAEDLADCWANDGRPDHTLSAMVIAPKMRRSGFMRNRFTREVGELSWHFKPVRRSVP